MDDLGPTRVAENVLFQPEDRTALASKHSPLKILDMNPLDLHFWAVAQSQVYNEEPESINSFVHCVKTFTEGYSQETTRKVCTNVLK